MSETASWWTVGAFGEPGNRLFLLQCDVASSPRCFIIEKAQAAWIVSQVQSFLATTRQAPIDVSTEPAAASLREDLAPEFRVAEISLGFETDEIAFELTELITEESTDEPRVVRFSSSVLVARAAAVAALGAVIAGRPICELCNQSIDPDGHICSGQNGHH